MDIKQKPKVPVTDADKAKHYFKYYEREPAFMAPQKMGKVFGPPMNPCDAVPFAERASILEEGFSKNEIGYCVMPDGTGYIADETFIPGGTAEMVDWFFAWRGLDPLRYIIVNPNENLSAMSMQTCYARDEDRTLQEKYWDTTQVIMKAGPMGPSTDYLNFKCPSSVGFDMSKIGPDQKTKTLVCGRNYAKGYPPMAAPDYFVCHQVTEGVGGINVFTRIWYGWSVRYGLDHKALPDGFRMQPHVPMTLMIGNAVEWGNIAAILPLLYHEEKDNF